MIRQPIVIIAGHIDHGKSSILERIKGISITRAESGGITQSIKSYNVQMESIEKCCGNLLKSLNQNITIPGLLFLDSPGHAAFNNMRKRGGNLADLAILVIDVNEGVMDQSAECIEILKQYKTPFIIALNKIDLVPGWRSNKNKSLLQNIESQTAEVKQELDTKLYEILGKLAEKGIDSERFDRITDYTKQIAMIPVSANTEEGMPELLMVLTGLAQKYLEEKLKISEETEGKATILEVQEDPGVGTTLDIILYDGQIKKGDQILIGTLNEPILTKVRGLFEPEGKKLKNVEKIHAAYGVRVSAPDLKGAIGGMPLIVANTNVEEKKHALQTEIESVMINTDNEGVVVKADTLGSLEALTALLQLEGISIKKASIGNITKKDLAEASAEINDINKVILGFNVKTTETDEKVKIISDGVVYKIIEDYQNWKKAEEKKEEQQKLDELTRPVKVKILKGCIFRQSGPCVVGVVVEGGMLKTGTRLIKADGSKAEYIKSIQHEQKTVNQIEQGKEVAVSIPNITAGRQIKEEDTLYSNLSETEFRKLKEMKDLLRKDEIEVLKEIAKIKRRDKPSWGI
ncbi:translation initiation factor IF-2 [Candidatus Woesearchaeota archaeon]|jgi:translation initiation factor 5B|nr:translation initiation factor IF-2 [Candidatus Woesearchaeota archaeon]MBT3438691.1 translation initiation factor IF-2 [Candidatus Woesearchaeota archaeon]MBT4058074.1 translation initiation factor IF-2 [Candidatus Woesearchaeota archaeon]MBT4208390.1 translation initiation factor IF-2 [Candidatus Woesearchaeota archaeon]MBT4730380.1 translation initiation factor IF-2 [Candidatus Woesearchaeota archaeon]